MWGNYIGCLLEGSFLPYFFAMLSTEIQDKIESLIQEKHPQLFVVDINMTRGKYAVLSIKVDKDGGVSLEECMNASRAIGWMLEEEDLIRSAYRLEVSSPGVGNPFKVRRQFTANVGRHLSIQTNDSRTLKGKLLEVKEEGILLELPEKKKKKKQTQALEIEEGPILVPFEEIQTAKVIVV